MIFARKSTVAAGPMPPSTPTVCLRTALTTVSPIKTRVSSSHCHHPRSEPARPVLRLYLSLRSQLPLKVEHPGRVIKRLGSLRPQHGEHDKAEDKPSKRDERSKNHWIWGQWDYGEVEGKTKKYGPQNRYDEVKEHIDFSSIVAVVVDRHCQESRHKQRDEEECLDLAEKEVGVEATKRQTAHECKEPIHHSEGQNRDSGCPVLRVCVAQSSREQRRSSHREDRPGSTVGPCLRIGVNTIEQRQKDEDPPPAPHTLC